MKHNQNIDGIKGTKAGLITDCKQVFQEICQVDTNYEQIIISQTFRSEFSSNEQNRMQLLGLTGKLSAPTGFLELSLG